MKVKPENPVAGLGLVLFLAAAAILVSSRPVPVRAAPVNAPVEEFSAGRAFAHVQQLVGRPRPGGSEANAQARAYLIETLETLGLQVAVQEAFVAPGLVLARVQNVVARLPGTQPGQAVLLVAHYDTVTSSPGASDNTGGVALLLETARALSAAGPLQNDVIFLFTDMEEMGLWGARAFAGQHPWMAQVRLVFNFDAGGGQGPLVMYETTSGNGWLVREFAKAVPYPFANSMMPEIYHRVAGKTDLDIFKEAGITGAGWGTTQVKAVAHSELDQAGNLDLDGLQHAGLNALALAQHFGNLNLPIKPSSQAIYFDVLGRGLVSYPQSWGGIIMVGVLALFLGVTLLGWQHGLVDLKAIGLGGLLLLASGVLMASVAAGVGTLLAWARPNFGLSLPLDAACNQVYLAGFVCLAAGTWASLLQWGTARWGQAGHPAPGSMSLGLGALLVWLLLAGAATLWLPATSFLFQWPLVFALLGLGLCFAMRPGPYGQALVWGLTALPGIVLLVPLVPAFYKDMATEMVYWPVAFVALILGLFGPHLGMAVQGRWSRALSLTVLSVGAVVLLAASWLALLGSGQPRASQLAYGLDLNTRQAYWLNPSDKLDQWNSRFLDGSLKPVPEFFPQWGDLLVYKTEAETAQLSEPQVQVLEDTYQNGARRLLLHVLVRAEASTAAVYLIAGPLPQEVAIDGTWLEIPSNLDPWTPFQLDYWAPPEAGFDLELRFDTNEAVELRIVDRSWGLEALPGFAGRERPPCWIAVPTRSSDMVLVTKRFQFAPVK